MTIHAFKDDKDGYYEVDLPDGAEMPEWTNSLVPCDRVIPVITVPTDAEVRADRDFRINEVAWRYERNAREVRLGLTPTDDIAALDKYVQALADVPSQNGFPDKVKWPTL